LGPQHGFARTKRWNVKKPLERTSEFCSLTLNLIDDEDTRNIWNFKFELEYVITLFEKSLKTELIIHNNGNNFMFI